VTSYALLHPTKLIEIDIYKGFIRWEFRICDERYYISSLGHLIYNTHAKGLREEVFAYNLIIMSLL